MLCLCSCLLRCPDSIACLAKTTRTRANEDDVVWSMKTRLAARCPYIKVMDMARAASIPVLSLQSKFESQLRNCGIKHPLTNCTIHFGDVTMSSTKPRWRHKLRRSEELKTEGLLSIDAAFGELKRPPFRFFALPRELRDAIYSWVFGASEGKQRHNLAAFKDPAITLVSKQARREAQSILFAGCCWLLTVGANYGEPSRKAETGQLGISPRVHRCLRAAGHDAVFRDIVVRVAGLSVVASIRRQHDQHPWVQNRLIASVHIKTHPSLEFDCFS